MYQLTFWKNIIEDHLKNMCKKDFDVKHYDMP